MRTQGNLETLISAPKKKGVDVRKELMTFYKTYYSASIAKLCVMGSGVCVCVCVGWVGG